MKSIGNGTEVKPKTPKLCHPQTKKGLKNGLCMKGSIVYQKDRGRWAVNWYEDLYHKRNYTITRYTPTWDYLMSEPMAFKQLSIMQTDYELHLRGDAQFRIEKYLGKGWTDVLEFYEEWMRTVIEPKRKPATIKGYWSYYRNWIKPFFEKHPIRLHEIQLDNLVCLLNSIKLSGKGKYNVMNALHVMMDYSWRSKRIREMPPFPKREDYNIVEPIIDWLPIERQMIIIMAIPEDHRPIFLWQKYHYRRPSEACALRKEDYDPINNLFIIRRSISARKEVESTKTGVEHVIPCDSRFKEYAIKCYKEDGIYMFTNKRARNHGKRYTNESLNNLWKNACKQTGENIDLYSGLKHSSCSQYLNEYNGNIYDLQHITDHANLESVRKYAKVSLARKRELMGRTHTKRIQNGNNIINLER